MRLREIAHQRGCQTTRDADSGVTGIVIIEDAPPTQITFINHINYCCYLTTTQASTPIASQVELVPPSRSTISSRRYIYQQRYR